jgi:hypothetical protein
MPDIEGERFLWDPWPRTEIASAFPVGSAVRPCFAGCEVLQSAHLFVGHINLATRIVHDLSLF